MRGGFGNSDWDKYTLQLDDNGKRIKPADGKQEKGSYDAPRTDREWNLNRVTAGGSGVESGKHILAQNIYNIYLRCMPLVVDNH